MEDVMIDMTGSTWKIRHDHRDRGRNHQQDATACFSLQEIPEGGHGPFGHVFSP
jgi:hypothetical protein